MALGFLWRMTWVRNFLICIKCENVRLLKKMMLRGRFPEIPIIIVKKWRTS